MVPFTKFFNFQSHHGIVDPEHVPFGWTIPRDLSKVVKKEAWEFLFHVQQHEGEHGDGAFQFKKWLDCGGHLQPNVEDSEYNPATVNMHPKARLQPRVKSWKVYSSSDSDSDSGENSDQDHTDAERWPEQGRSNSQKATSRAMSDLGPSNDVHSENRDFREWGKIPDLKGKGREVSGVHTWEEDSHPRREIQEYGQYQELSYQNPVTTVLQQGHCEYHHSMHKLSIHASFILQISAKSFGQLLKPAIKKIYGAWSNLRHARGIPLTTALQIPNIQPSPWRSGLNWQLRNPTHLRAVQDKPWKILQTTTPQILDILTLTSPMLQISICPWWSSTIQGCCRWWWPQVQAQVWTSAEETS